MHPSRRATIENSLNELLRSGAAVTQVCSYIRECFAAMDALQAEVDRLRDALAARDRAAVNSADPSGS